ncbi:hypothetical protein [Flavobacterium aestivum]|uniref:hypothetical protein n=1 Tax=Flavobacterium aestivum TaxID=3003257 RepID=UPI002286A1A3|nr:hypothetical protein [Flavobacterium aestivum]
MTQLQTHNNQSWFDISVWIYGTIDYALTLALQNNSSLTIDVPAGTFIDVPDLPKNARILVALKNIPATSVSINETVYPTVGIGSMIIETNFTVR